MIAKSIDKDMKKEMVRESEDENGNFSQKIV